MTQVTQESAYRAGYAYLRSIVDPLNDEQLQAACPHCPEWSMRDVLAHLMMVAERSVEFPPDFRRRVRASLINSDPEDQRLASEVRDNFWNDVVESLRPVTIPDLFARWEAALDTLEGEQWRIVADFAVHVGDLDEALGHAGSRELHVHAHALDVYAFLLNGQLQAHELATVVVVGSRPNTTAGNPDAEHRVTGSTYDLLRVATGRRTRDEANQALDWGTTPNECIELFPVYHWLSESRRDVLID